MHNQFFSTIVLPLLCSFLTSHLLNNSHTASRTVRPKHPTIGCKGLQAGTDVTSLVMTDANRTPVGEEVQKLLDKGTIKVVNSCPSIYGPKGTFRPVINLQPLNQSMVNTHFKMEGLAMLNDLLDPSILLTHKQTIWRGHKQ